MVGRSILTIIPPELQHEEPVILAKIRAGERLEHYETYRTTSQDAESKSHLPSRLCVTHGAA